MKPIEWLLLLVADSADATLDPIRIQKGIFLFQQESDLPEEDSYSFVPYSYGPCSFEIYRHLDRLAEEGLISISLDENRGFKRYSPTDDGTAKAARLRAVADATLLGKLDSVYNYVTTVGFFDLLRRIYSEYPEYAAKTLLSDLTDSN